ncbi:general stress protein [Sporosarcina cyprini]|uniref:general stress protein n=1 Tax=Sporosarcina cyprini TaxID=2910523 RepID=UPI001EDD63C2|nr:general stress protein [Sporosarcina cyprini]MCG3088096.1 general stress protein [Sporosarcina cyprini]
MKEKTFIGLYDNLDEMTSKINELDHKGIDPSRIFVIAKEETAVSALRHRTSEEIQSEPSSWFDQFIGFLSGEDRIETMLVEAGFDSSEAKQYYEEVEMGKYLVYIDGTVEKTVYEVHADQQNEQEENPFDPIEMLPGKSPKEQEEATEQNPVGRKGREALFDHTRYEEDHDTSREAATRGYPQSDREKELIRDYYEHQIEEHRAEEQVDIVPDAFQESQMDRQDAIAEEAASIETVIPPLESGHKKKEPIIIDLRNIPREHKQ